ncbi:ATP-binding protein [Leptolyngbya sp. FACHB-321]|uniref:ATP-binding protein n=1 Tax=Leptolyngbya sp. FACHB-321 TaxID=2692807 RepID=UPI0016857163|nr:ATP-binding protein [Leptolyngbya sp. FACHB-321]MBD2037916.1 ATP-binding protein [Leptolyngbya sp. FACHB-321]
MSTTPRPRPEAYVENDRSLDTLIRAITLSRHQFALILVRCNYTKLRDHLMQQFNKNCPFPVREYTLPESAKTLYTSIRTEMKDDGQTCGAAAETGAQEEFAQSLEVQSAANVNTTPDAQLLASGEPSPRCQPPNALMVYGLESVTAIDQVLLATNLVREELRKKFPFPLVLWINDRILAKLDRLAPDLKSWAGNTVISFDVAAEDVVEGLRQHTDRLFASILDAGDEQFLPNWALLQPGNTGTWGTNSLRRTELEFALDRVLTSGQTFDPALQASLDFLLGQDAHAQGELETARLCYEHSLKFWREESKRQQAQKLSESFVLLPSARERSACVLVYLGLWWRSQAMQQRTAYANACQQARNYFRRGLEVFEQANRQDLVARFIIPQAETLQKLQQWHELEMMAKKALVLHKLYADPVRQARDHGFLAEVALARSDWAEAKQQAETALQILATTAATIEQVADPPPNPHLEFSLEMARRYHQGWYLLLLGRAAANLGQIEAAIDHLEAAQNQTYPLDDPQLYINILRHLRELYFQQGRYLEAFYTKQTRRSLEHQYGFRAFVGALRLEPQQPLPALLPGQPLPESPLALEIKASGRQQDVDRLVARMGRNDFKLTVIHGPSGVGKSSIVNAGLVPALKERAIGDRLALPILLDVYTDWQATLEAKLAIALRWQEADGRRQETEDNTTQALPHPSSPLPSLIAQLRQATSLNRLPVLIFDQFEEFFFVHETVQQRRPFYEFLRDCLHLDFVKVVLTLREDYLHHLLEFHRYASRDGINLDSITDILGKDVRYALNDFSPEDARSIIKSLTNRAQFYLDEALVEALVHDLAGEDGAVRAIELQAVGAQLQAEGITTLADYRQKGPKAKLVARSLDNVVEDCGTENEVAARNVLFLLTNENGTRPLKSREDLETDLVDLGLTAEINKLDLVLDVLVGSGLLFLVPENPANRYQLVHDYLVSFIRQQQAETVANLELHDRSDDASEPEQSRKRLISLQEQNMFPKDSLHPARFTRRSLKPLLLLFLMTLLAAMLAVSLKPHSSTYQPQKATAIASHTVAKP